MVMNAIKSILSIWIRLLNRKGKYMHYVMIDNSEGDLIEAIPVCSESCGRQYCSDIGLDYGGFNGCHELEFDGLCGSCNSVIVGVSGAYDN